MPLIEWSDFLNTGIDSVDKQHKILVNMLNELNDAMLAGKADLVLTKIFDGLAVYTVKHFAHEEELFAKYNYPDEEAHKKEHADLLQQVSELKQKMDEGDFMINIELINFLKEWLTHHILKTDMAFGPYLIEMGAT